jgi:hypothetical protein
MKERGQALDISGSKAAVGVCLHVHRLPWTVGYLRQHCGGGLMMRRNNWAGWIALACLIVSPVLLDQQATAAVSPAVAA